MLMLPIIKFWEASPHWNYFQLMGFVHKVSFKVRAAMGKKHRNERTETKEYGGSYLKKGLHDSRLKSWIGEKSWI